MEADEHPLYVRIDDPIEIRRSLLESNKDAINILQLKEEFKKTRKQKYELEEKLPEVVNHIIQLVSRLKSLLPKVKIRSLPKKVKLEIEPQLMPEPEEAPNVVIPDIKPTHLTEAERLEYELQQIEKKLGKL